MYVAMWTIIGRYIIHLGKDSCYTAVCQYWSPDSQILLGMSSFLSVFRHCKFGCSWTIGPTGSKNLEWLHGGMCVSMTS